MTVAQSTTASQGRILRHLLLPAIAPAAIVALYFTPISLIGCANRGLLALAVAAVSAVAAFVTVAVAIRRGARQDPAAGWWIVTTLVLALPLVLLLGPLG
jgi:hypothetical protein